jgi:hypothetical protein
MCFALGAYYERHVARVPGGTCILVAVLEAICYIDWCLAIVGYLAFCRSGGVCLILYWHLTG